MADFAHIASSPSPGVKWRHLAGNQPHASVSLIEPRVPNRGRRTSGRDSSALPVETRLHFRSGLVCTSVQDSSALPVETRLHFRSGLVCTSGQDSSALPVGTPLHFRSGLVCTSGRNSLHFRSGLVCTAVWSQCRIGGKSDVGRVTLCETESFHSQPTFPRLFLSLIH